MGTARLFILELGCGVSVPSVHSHIDVLLADIHGGSLDGQPWPRDGSEKTTVLRINPEALGYFKETCARNPDYSRWTPPSQQVVPSLRSRYRVVWWLSYFFLGL